MRLTRTRKAVAFLLLFAMFLAVVPPPAFAADTDSAEQATGESAADRTTIKAQNVEPETGQTTELPASSDPSESPASGASPDGAPAGGLTFIKILADGSIVFDDPKQTGGSKAPPENTILYKDIFGAHGSDMSYYGIKAGGAYTAYAYGANDTAWFPLSTWDGNKELSYDGYHYVCTGAMYCNRGPYSYICTEIAGAYTYLALPIRPSQEDGGDGTYSTDNYVSSTGVPTYKLEILKSKQIPAYTQDEFTTINLIGAVAKGMGGMTYTGDGNLSAAGYTLIMNVVLGYIGLGSDGLFHGLPLCTTSTAVNQKMCEILVRCEVYSKEKGLTGNAGGDATLAQLKSKLNYTPTNMTGWYVKSGTATYSRVHYLQINRSQSSGNQIYIWSDNEIDFDNGQPVSLKKTSSASASVMACIQGNPRYTLRGAVYEIHQGSATGPVVETLITDANGNATGTVKYAVNTVLYAVEKTAPSGYLLNSTPVPLTVSADSSQNVFNVSDEPTFDPRAFEIKKTGTDSELIQGAIFKADFYASTWMDSTKLLRTWYLKSDSNGRVFFDDAHLLSSYGGNSSDELFKPYTNSGVQFPLGCVYIQEIQAADGYITPVGNDAGVLIFIDQPTSGGAAEAYWGDAAGQPITTQNPRGIYKMENDSDGTVITAENQEIYGTPPSIKKVDPSNVSLEGAVFEVTYYNAAYSSAATDIRTWYFKTNANGTFELKNSYLASGYTSTGALFPVDKIPLGLMRIKEVEAPAGFETSDTVAFWRMKQNGNTDKSYWVESDGYTETTSYGDDVYVPSGSSSGELYFGNEPIPGTMTMRKTLPANTPGGVEGYYFNLFRAESSTVWYGRTDASGKIYKTNASHAAVAEGSRVYQFEGLLDGTYSLRELLSQRDFKNTKTTKIRITTSGGTTASVDLTYQGNALNWDTNGDCYISGVPITGLNGGGTLSIEITNAPIYGGPPTLVKKDASTDLPLEGAIFQVDYYSSEAPTATTFERRWFLRSDDDGCVTLDVAHLVNTSEYQSDELYETGKLPIGCIRVEEVEAPEGFRKSDSIGYWYMKLTNPQTFAVSNYWGDADGEPTDDYGEDAYVIDNELYVENTPSNTLTIRKTSSNGRIKGITFEVRQYVTGHGWLPLGDGTYVTGDGGKIEIPDLPAGTRVQIKEIVQEGSICLSQNPQEITLQIGDNPVNFENVDISLKIKKECSDGKIDGITFKVEKKVNGSWTLIGSYVTGTDGIIPIATEHLAIGAEFRITETAPQNYICVNTPDGVQTVTLHEGENVVTFVNKPVVNLKVIKQSDDGNVAEIEFKLYRRNKSGIFEYVETYVTDTDGFIVDEEVLEAGKTYKLVETVPENYVADEREKIFVARLGQNTVTFINHPVVTLKIVKHNTDPDGPVDGFKFKVERKMTGSTSGSVSMKERWASLGTYITANGGIVLIDEQGLLHEGDVLRITEIELGDYVCLSENPQTVTLALGENVVEFTNKLGIELEIIKESDDGKVSGITFTVERKKSDEDYSFEGSYTTGQNGTIHLEDLELGVTYRVTETLPYGYTNDHN